MILEEVIGLWYDEGICRTLIASFDTMSEACFAAWVERSLSETVLPDLRISWKGGYF